MSHCGSEAVSRNGQAVALVPISEVDTVIILLTSLIGTKPSAGHGSNSRASISSQVGGVNPGTVMVRDSACPVDLAVAAKEFNFEQPCTV